MNPVKFLDLTAQYPMIREDIMQKFNEIIDGASFISGKYVKLFEEDFSAYCGAKHTIAVNNGTSALYLIFLGLGIQPGDEIILPVNTFIATAEAVSLVGAVPVFVDMDDFYTIDVTKIEEKITPRTKAIVPVHLYGQCADMDPILEIARRHNIFVVEDACQAHGAQYKGKPAGSLADAAAFSFYPGKNLGAWGEGGAVVTSNDKLADTIRLMREHGSRVKYSHEVLGSNFRINEFQGAVLHTKLPFLQGWNESRRKNAALYLEFLKNSSALVLPKVRIDCASVWHLFVVRVKNREQVMTALKEKGIQSAIHYPFPLHLTQVYKHCAVRGDFPMAEKAANEIMSLPMYAELTLEEIKRVVHELS